MANNGKRVAYVRETYVFPYRNKQEREPDMTTATVQSRIAVNLDATHVNEELRLSEVISALSYALDIVEGQPEGHAMRSCLIGMRIAG